MIGKNISPIKISRKNSVGIRLIVFYSIIITNIFSLSGIGLLAQENWRRLFNGQNLDGWIIKIAGQDLQDNYLNTFRVEDGLLKISYDNYKKFEGKFGHIFFNEKFSHYRLRLEYRFIGEQTPEAPAWAYRNSGIMILCQSPQSMTSDQSFPVSIEVQLLGGNGSDERSTGNLCTPGTNVVMNGQLVRRHCTNSSSKTYHGDVWVKAEVEVLSNGIIKHFIDGEKVLEYEQPQLDDTDPDANKLITDGNLMLHDGYIALQAESHPVQFRNIEILVLHD